MALLEIAWSERKRWLRRSDVHDSSPRLRGRSPPSREPLCSTTCGVALPGQSELRGLPLVLDDYCASSLDARQAPQQAAQAPQHAQQHQAQLQSSKHVESAEVSTSSGTAASDRFCDVEGAMAGLDTGPDAGAGCVTPSCLTTAWSSSDCSSAAVPPIARASPTATVLSPSASRVDYASDQVDAYGIDAANVGGGGMVKLDAVAAASLLSPGRTDSLTSACFRAPALLGLGGNGAGSESSLVAETPLPTFTISLSDLACQDFFSNITFVPTGSGLASLPTPLGQLRRGRTLAESSDVCVSASGGMDVSAGEEHRLIPEFPDSLNSTGCVQEVASSGVPFACVSSSARTTGLLSTSDALAMVIKSEKLRLQEGFVPKKVAENLAADNQRLLDENVKISATNDELRRTVMSLLREKAALSLQAERSAKEVSLLQQQVEEGTLWARQLEKQAEASARSVAALQEAHASHLALAQSQRPWQPSQRELARGVPSPGVTPTDCFSKLADDVPAQGPLDDLWEMLRSRTESWSSTPMGMSPRTCDRELAAYSPAASMPLNPVQDESDVGTQTTEVSSKSRVVKISYGAAMRSVESESSSRSVASAAQAPGASTNIVIGVEVSGMSTELAPQVLVPAPTLVHTGASCVHPSGAAGTAPEFSSATSRLLAALSSVGSMSPPSFPAAQPVAMPMAACSSSPRFHPAASLRGAGSSKGSLFRPQSASPVGCVTRLFSAPGGALSFLPRVGHLPKQGSCRPTMPGENLPQTQSSANSSALRVINADTFGRKNTRVPKKWEDCPKVEVSGEKCGGDVLSGRDLPPPQGAEQQSSRAGTVCSLLFPTAAPSTSAGGSAGVVAVEGRKFQQQCSMIATAQSALQNGTSSPTVPQYQVFSSPSAVGVPQASSPMVSPYPQAAQPTSSVRAGASATVTFTSAAASGHAPARGVAGTPTRRPQVISALGVSGAVAESAADLSAAGSNTMATAVSPFLSPSSTQSDSTCSHSNTATTDPSASRTTPKCAVSAVRSVLRGAPTMGLTRATQPTGAPGTTSLSRAHFPPSPAVTPRLQAGPSPHGSSTCDSVAGLRPGRPMTSYHASVGVSGGITSSVRRSYSDGLR